MFSTRGREFQCLDFAAIEMTLDDDSYGDEEESLNSQYFTKILITITMETDKHDSRGYYLDIPPNSQNVVCGNHYREDGSQFSHWN